MKIQSEYKKKLIEIDIPDSKYWIDRNKQRISSYWNNADNLDNRIKKEFLKAYKELEKELYTFIGKVGKDGVMSYSNARVIQLMKLLVPYIDDLYEFQQLSITQLLTDTYKDNYYKSLYTISTGIKIAKSFIGIDGTLIKTALSFPWSGENFSERIYNNKRKLINVMRQEITQGFIRGDNVNKIASVFKDKMNITYKNSKRLIQTETGAVITESSKRSYKELDLDKYEYISTLDSRTSDICRKMDNNTFYIDEMIIGVNAPPMHVNCRSDIAPYVDNNTGERIAKRLDTGKYEYISANISYEEWEKKFIK